jgi:hypothetical protein
LPTAAKSARIRSSRFGSRRDAVSLIVPNKYAWACSKVIALYNVSDVLPVNGQIGQEIKSVRERG